MTKVQYSTENATESGKSRGSNLIVLCKNHEDAQSIMGRHTQKAPSRKDVTRKKPWVLSQGTMVALAGAPQPKSGAGHMVGGQKAELNFCCVYLKLQRTC